jgi:hypothetical protein
LCFDQNNARTSGHYSFVALGDIASLIRCPEVPNDRYQPITALLIKPAYLGNLQKKPTLGV